jgi:DNA polymerase V
VVLKVVLLKILAMEEEALEQIKIPYFPAKVPAGFPSPAMDYMEERIDLNKTFIEHPLSTFIIQCEGTSMINAFIPPKAKLLIDKSLTPKNGDSVLTVLDGEFTVKKPKAKSFLAQSLCANFSKINAMFAVFLHP